jgi:hypothetical protein
VPRGLGLISVSVKREGDGVEGKNDLVSGCDSSMSDELGSTLPFYMYEYGILKPVEVILRRRVEKRKNTGGGETN